MASAGKNAQFFCAVVLQARACSLSEHGQTHPLASLHPMIITTTPGVEGKTITKYFGVVAGEVIVGTNVFKDMFAGIRDLVGGRAGSNERELQKAREIAMAEMQERAVRLGANAIVGVQLDYEVLGAANSMFMVSASGTAVMLG